MKSLITPILLLAVGAVAQNDGWKPSDVTAHEITHETWVWMSGPDSQPAFHGGILSATIVGSCGQFDRVEGRDSWGEGRVLFWTCGDSDKLSESIHLYVSNQTVDNSFATTDEACNRDTCLQGLDWKALKWLPNGNGQTASDWTKGADRSRNGGEWNVQHQLKEGHCVTMATHFFQHYGEIGWFEVLDSRTVLSVVFMTDTAKKPDFMKDWRDLLDSFHFVLAQ